MTSPREKGPTDIETGDQIADGQHNVTESRLPDHEVG